MNAQPFLDAAASMRGPSGASWTADPTEEFRAAMAAAGMVYGGDIKGDGKLHRISCAGEKNKGKPGYYVLHLDGRPAGLFGHYRLGIKENWKAGGGGGGFTKADLARFAKMREDAEADRRKAYDRVAKTAAARWARYRPAPDDHPYLARKQVGPHGAKVDDQGDLVVAVSAASGEIRSLQTIGGGGEKRFMFGGEAGGGMFAIGEPGDRIVVAEGFATAASIHEATGMGVVAAFNAGNLETVARAIRGRHPAARIIVAADDDRDTPGNPGLTAARKAAEAVGGVVVDPGIDRKADFNDLFVAEGAAAVAARFGIEREPLSEVQGDFRVQADGVYFKKHRITSRVDVLGMCRDGDGKGWGRYLAVHDPDGGVHHVVMPSAATVGDNGECIRTLVDLGMAPPIGREDRDLTVRYVCTWATEARARSVARIGWHGGAFVLPDRAFGAQAETVVLQTNRPVKFKLAGTLDGWKQEVATPAIGNSRLVFAIAAGFAGPLLHLTGQESGGFHFRGPSSIGKTSALHAARSVWGCPLGSWRTTDNASEAAAAGACDTLLLLDEVSQAKASAVDAMAYMLANGAGKARADRTGAAREVASWRILLLSTGETGLADKIAEDNGKQSRAGQSVRVVDIPADAGEGLGVFDTLHGFADGAALSTRLRLSGEAHSGHAARAFLERITEDPDAIAAFARGWMAKWLDATVPADADGQVKRVADRFALVAAAGELAAAKGVLPWQVGEATKAASRCFGDWLSARGGNGAEEITAGIRQVRKFLEMHGSSRFEAAWEPGPKLPAGEAPIEKVVNRAGFRKLEGSDADKCWEFFILPEAWRSEVCRGLDATAIAKHMVDKGWITAGEGRHLGCKTRVPGHGPIRVFRIASAFLAVDDEADLKGDGQTGNDQAGDDQ